MVKKARHGSVRRFGSRYGRRVRDKVAMVESQLKKAHKCPSCSQLKVFRISAGIWECKKCGAKFAGRAYVPSIEENRIELKTEAEASE